MCIRDRINAVEEYDGQKVVRIRMAWKATGGQICRWLGYWLLLIIPSVVLLLQEVKVVNFDEIKAGKVNEWWRYGIIGWGILATLYVTARGRQLFVKKKEKWTEINVVNENDPTQSLLGINDNDMKDEYMLWLKWIRQVRHRRRIIAMAVTTVIWLTALILVSYGAAKRHFVCLLYTSPSPRDRG